MAGLTQVATRRVAGTTQGLSDRREIPLWDRPTVSVAQTRWGTPPGHIPGVRFATREPAAVIQTVVHCMLQNRFAGCRIRRVAGKHIGKATSRVRYLPNHRTHDTKFNSLLSRAFWCVIAWVVCSRLTVKRYNLCIKEAPHTTLSYVLLRVFSGTT